MKQIITISGDIGSGKSAVSKCLHAVFGYEVIGTGAIQREIAKKRGMTTLELNVASITDKSVDEEIDNFVIELGRTRDRIIIDSRLAWHFIPEAFKSFLLVDPVIGATRVFADKRTEEENPTLEQTLENNARRRTLESERFRALYGVELREFENYDAVVDTSYSRPDTIAAKLRELYELALRQVRFPRLWLNPKRLLPTQKITQYREDEIDRVRESLRRDGVDYQRPIEVIEADDFYFVRDGHKRSIAAHFENIELLPCVVVAKSGDDEVMPGLSVREVIRNLEKSWFSDWEDRLGYKMSRYPKHG